MSFAASDRSRDPTSPLLHLRTLRRERVMVSREARTLAGRIAELESFIAAAPAAMERRRLRFQDTLPPPDADAVRGGGWRQGRLPSRRELYEASLRRAGSLLLLGALLLAAGAIAYFIYVLSHRGN